MKLFSKERFKIDFLSLNQERDTIKFSWSKKVGVHCEIN